MISNNINSGQLLWLGFQGTKIPREVKLLLSNGEVGGIILFSRNIETPEQTQDLIKEMKSIAPDHLPLAVGVDQEGGRVKRMDSIDWPSAQAMLNSNDPKWVYEIGRAMGHELSWFGFNTNFAPVLDILTEKTNKVIGDRAFGTNPENVIQFASSWIEGFKTSKISNCGKHFPGHGMVVHDSHLTLPVASRNMADILSSEIRPFKELAPELDMIMTAHVLFENIDPKYPATFSSTILQLAKNISFKGILVSDDLEMGALSSYSTLDRGILTMKAGADMAMVCSNLDIFLDVKEGIDREIENNNNFANNINQKLQKVIAWKKNLPVFNKKYANENYNNIVNIYTELSGKYNLS